MKNLTYLLMLAATLSIWSCKDDDDDTDNNVRVNVPCSVINTSQTFNTGKTYVISCALTVTNSAVLTIEPGTVLEFTEDGSLTTDNGGSIKAVGTAAKRITFTGAEEISGYWEGIDINTNSLNNQFEYCTFEYGGKGPRSMVRLGEDGYDIAKAVFKHCAFA